MTGRRLTASELKVAYQEEITQQILQRLDDLKNFAISKLDKKLSFQQIPTKVMQMQPKANVSIPSRPRSNKTSLNNANR